MMLKTIQVNIEIFDSVDALPLQWQTLMLAAQKCTETAYAPYSHFKVGAAVLLENQKIILGNNQENMAYPSGLCAERVALFTAGVQCPHEKIDAIAIAATRSGNLFLDCSPCGACRQVMAEYQHKQVAPIKVLFQIDNGKLCLFESVKDLLPFVFELQ